MRNLRHHFEKKKKIADAHIDPKLLLRLIIFSLIIGTSIGYIAGRMFRIFWHEELERVMSEFDMMGVISLTMISAIRSILVEKAKI